MWWKLQGSNKQHVKRQIKRQLVICGGGKIKVEKEKKSEGEGNMKVGKEENLCEVYIDDFYVAFQCSFIMLKARHVFIII